MSILPIRKDGTQCLQEQPLRVCCGVRGDPHKYAFKTIFLIFMEHGRHKMIVESHFMGIPWAQIYQSTGQAYRRRSSRLRYRELVQ